MNIVKFVADDLVAFNSTNWRDIIPARALQARGHTVRMIPIQHWMEATPFGKRLCAEADLIVLQRVLIEDSIRRAGAYRQKAIVVDIDDAYQRIQADNQAYIFWGRGRVEIHAGMGVKYEKPLEVHPLQQFVRGLRVITGITMPSKILAEDWRWAGHCWVIPNYIDTERYTKVLGYIQPDPRYVTIGYGGSMSHVPSFELSGIIPALCRIAAARPHVRIMICGDRRIYDLLPIAPDRKIHIPYVRYDEWPTVLGLFDIGIAPMARRYDDSRSAIKPEEYCTMGIPYVATRSPAYQDFIDAEQGVFVDGGEDDEQRESRADQWISALLEVVDHLTDWKHQAQAHYRPFCFEQFDVNQNVGKIERVYQNILETHQWTL